MLIHMRGQSFPESPPIFGARRLFHTGEAWSDRLLHFYQSVMIPTRGIDEGFGKKGFQGAVLNFELATILEEQL